MKDYYTLTSMGKARRLRGLALRALENYDLHVARRMNLVNYILYSRDEDIADHPRAIPLLMRRVRDALARPGIPRTS
jgi:hypothetical protein